MMRITFSNAGKRFNRDWIFRHFTYTFETGRSYAITGPNGSGKSTLLQVLSGSMMLNEGSVQWATDNPSNNTQKQLTNEEIYNHISICAPYLEVIEEMTLREFLKFHSGFKPFLQGVAIDMIISVLGLENASDKQIRYYSSGMKQRVKLAQSVFSDSAIVLLDEPCTNLDIEGVNLYHRLIDVYCKTRLVIVSSNDEVEYKFCKETLNIVEYK